MHPRINTDVEIISLLNRKIHTLVDLGQGRFVNVAVRFVQQDRLFEVVIRGIHNGKPHPVPPGGADKHRYCIQINDGCGSEGELHINIGIVRLCAAFRPFHLEHMEFMVRSVRTSGRITYRTLGTDIGSVLQSASRLGERLHRTRDYRVGVLGQMPVDFDICAERIYRRGLGGCGRLCIDGAEALAPTREEIAFPGRVFGFIGSFSTENIRLGKDTSIPIYKSNCNGTDIQTHQ